MGRLFGTDGVRGVANHDLTCELAMKLGRAAAAVLINKSNRHRASSSARIPVFRATCWKTPWQPACAA